MQLQQALQKCDCVAQTLLLQTLEVPAAGEEFPSQMEINEFHGFFCAPTEGLAQLLWLEKTRAWSRCKKTKMEGEIWWTPNGVIQNAIQHLNLPFEWHRRWELPPQCATHTVWGLAQDFSSQAASSESLRERRVISGILVLQRKNMKQPEMTEKWECWMMANSIWGAGEREIWHPCCSITSQPNSHWSLGASSFLLEESGSWDSRYKIKNSQFLEHQC